jgi:hypothetical protein
MGSAEVYSASDHSSSYRALFSLSTVAAREHLFATLFRLHAAPPRCLAPIAFFTFEG